MCVCKTHLHARRAVNALVALCKKQEVDLADINDYDSFFASLTSNCPKSDTKFTGCDCKDKNKTCDCPKKHTTYISWDCAEDQKKTCIHVQDKWEKLKSTILPKSEPDSTVPLSTFVKKPYRTKKGKDIFRLEAETKQVDLSAIVKFIDDMLAKIIHHRNQLKHYRNTVKAAIKLFDCIEIDLDFSEKLTVPLKYEPQSMHWTNAQIIVHSAIMKSLGEKTYHPYLSDDKFQGYVFVSLSLDEILSETDVGGRFILVESDNCTAQYKCVAHFAKLQQLADDHNTTVIRIFSVAGHGKGEVDHVGGVAKVKVRREVAAGKKLQFADEMVQFLSEKFGEKTDPGYKFKDITPEQLEEARKEQRLKIYSTIAGSSKFQATVFRPHQRMKASPRICLCKECQVEYGSCQLFKEYDITINHLKKICLRSTFADRIGAEALEDDESIDDDETTEVLIKDSIVALAAGTNARETFYLIKITEEEREASTAETDEWGTNITGGQLHLRGQFFETESGYDRRYKLLKKEAIFFRESVVYPFVQMEAKNNYYELSADEYMQITRYIENSRLGFM